MKLSEQQAVTTCVCLLFWIAPSHCRHENTFGNWGRGGDGGSIYMYIYIYTYVYVRMCTYVHMYICLHAYMCACVYVHDVCV